MSNPLDGKVCTTTDLQRHQAAGHSDPDVYCLTRGQTVGLSFTGASGMFSGLAVLVVFVLVIRNVKRSPGAQLIKQAMDVYVLLIFSADLVQALGIAMNIKWVNDGKVEMGDFCAAQGTVAQLGEVTVAIITLIITVHTFRMVRTGKDSYTPGVRGACIISAAVLLFVTSHLYEVPTPLWCWIGEKYLAYRIAGEYIWFWLTLLLAIVLYILLFFTLMPGQMSWNPRLWRKQWVQWMQTDDAKERGRRRTALCMTVYPIVYSIVIIPLSISRWIGFHQERTGDKQNHVPSAFTLTGISLFGLSGLFNVILFVFTRPNLLLFEPVNAVVAIDMELRRNVHVQTDMPPDV